MSSTTDSGDGSEGRSTMITLISSDKERFVVPSAVASLSGLISNMIEDGCAEGDIPLPNVSGSVLAKVLEYCTAHASLGNDDGWLLTDFDKKFIDGVGLAMLYDLLMAANYLVIDGLLGVAAHKVADLIKDKTPEQIRRTFGIKRHVQPREEEIGEDDDARAFEEEEEEEIHEEKATRAFEEEEEIPEEKARAFDE